MPISLSECLPTGADQRFKLGALWLAHQLVLLALLEDLSLYFTVAPAYVTCCSYES